MSIHVIDTFEPLGKFPVVHSKDIDCDNGKRLDAALNSKAESSTVSALQAEVNGKADAQALTNLQTEVNTKASSAALSSLQTEVNGKVSKESGKGLSANDYSDAEKAKVSNTASEVSRIGGYFTMV